MIWSVKINGHLTSNNLIKTNTLRGNQESRFEVPDFGHNTLGTQYQSSKTNQMDEFHRKNEKRSVDFWADMLSENGSAWKR